MYAEEEVIEKIKSNYKIGVAPILITMLMIPIAFVVLIFVSDIKNSPIATSISAGIGVIFTLTVCYFLIKNKIIQHAFSTNIDISSDPVFRSFGTIKGLVSALNEAKQAEAIYEYNETKITDKYIVDFSNPCSITRLEDITKLNNDGDPHDTRIQIISVEDIHNRYNTFVVSKDYKNAIHVVHLLAEKCPNILDKSLENMPPSIL